MTAASARERLAIEQGVARGWSASVIADRVGVPVDVVHAVWDDLDEAVGLIPPSTDGQRAACRRPTREEWIVLFRDAYARLGSVARVCEDLGVTVHAAEMRWRRWDKTDPLHKLLMWERRRLRWEAKAAVDEGVAA